MHLRGAVEVVPAAADLLLPPQTLRGIEIKVIPIPVKLLPPFQRLTISTKVALQSVRAPSDPTSYHGAATVEIVPFATDLLLPAHRYTFGVEVVALVTNRFPVRLHQRAVVVDILEPVADRFQTRHDGLDGLYRVVRPLGLRLIGAIRRIIGADLFVGPVRITRAIRAILLEHHSLGGIGGGFDHLRTDLVERLFRSYGAAIGPRSSTFALLRKGEGGHASKRSRKRGNQPRGTKPVRGSLFQASHNRPPLNADIMSV